MRKTIRWLIILTFVLSVDLLNGSAKLAAEPSAAECLENPSHEECSQSNPTEDQDDSTVDGSETEESTTEEPSLVWNIVKLVFVLLLVLALIYGLLKFFNQKNKIFHKNQTMENLGGMNLGPNRSIQAVRIGQQVFILGVGDSVEIITEITDEQTKGSLLNQEQSQGFDRSFGLGNWFKKSQKNEKAPTQTSTVQFQQLFENQLKDMKRKRDHAASQEQEDRHNE